MIEEQFLAALEQHPDKPFIVSSQGEWSYSEFNDYVCKVAAALMSLQPGRVAFHLPDSPLLVALMLAGDLAGRSIVLINHDYPSEQVRSLLCEIDVVALISDTAVIKDAAYTVLHPRALNISNQQVKPAPTSGTGSELLILTSGTTGKAKCARYDWDRLAAQITRNEKVSDDRWLLAYRLNHFAGVQMLLHVLVSGSTLVLPDSNQVSDAIDAIIKFDVTHVSSTPTFWRYAASLLVDKQDQIHLRHLTLGSEAAPGDLLQQLHELFPTARIVHIYASTEAGSCVSVSDLKPGLPISILSRPTTAATQFRIADGELYIKSSNGMSGYISADSEQPSGIPEDGWRASGDLVKVENDRIMFVGRKSETINVGGVKVHPLEVENAVSPIDGVKLVRAYGQANPIVGQIVAVDVVCEAGSNQDVVEAAIREAAMSLPRFSRPRSINFVATILTNNNKLSRK